jgi:thiamine-phosphate pyrophosphorylase
MNFTKNLHGIYAITDEHLTPNDIILDRVKLALIGGVSIIQLRDKSSSDEALEPIAQKIQKMCREYNALFIINDRANLALENCFDGLHIGKDDIKLTSIRDIFNGVIGVSCYGSIELAREYQEKGADYVAFGAMFKSSTKNATLTPIDIIKEAKKHIDIPICAIGGIKSSNVHKLNPKPDMVGVVNDIFKDDNIISNVNKLKENFI